MATEIFGDMAPFVARDGIVQITFDRIVEGREGEIRAEVEIKVTGELGGHVFQGRANLLSAQGKRQLQQAGEGRFPFEQYNIDWGAIVESSCKGVVERYRTGEPVYRLDAIPASDALRFRVEPYVVERMPSLIYGDGGLGKSFLAVMIACSVQEGFPTTVLPDVERGNVLYLDWEAEPNEILTRAQAISRGADMGLEDDRPLFHYRFMTSSLQNDRERVQRIVNELGIDLVIIDSAGPACGGQPEAADSTLAFFAALRSLRCSALILAHTAKGSDGKSGPFGSVYWTNMSRTVWEMRRAESVAGSNGVNVGLFHRKVNSGARFPSRAISIRWLTDDQRRQLVSIEPSRINTGSDLSKGERLVDRIATSIREIGPQSADQIWESLGGSDSGTTLNTVRNYLSGNKNMFVRLPNTNAYGLVTTKYQGELVPSRDFGFDESS